MKPEYFFHLSYQTAELLAIGFVFLILLAFAIFLNRRNENADSSADDFDAEDQSAGDLRTLRFRGSSNRDPRFLLLGAGAADSEVAPDGVTPAPLRSRLAADHTRDLAHWLFDGGDVIAVEDDFFVNVQADQDADRDWRNFLARLKQHRPRRPIDGLILNLHANRLVGSGAVADTDLRKRAAGTARRLQILRQQLGFYLPVYVLVSGCEAIDGFSVFIQAHPDSDPGQIFGWSTPHRPEAVFSAYWTAQAFAEVLRVLAGLRMQWFAQTVAPASASQEMRDKMFLFPSNFAALESPVASFLNCMFTELGAGGAVQFRGLYFSGALSSSTAASPPARQSLFTRDLLKKKMVPERVLARPTDVTFARSAACSAVASAACVVAALLLALGTLIGWYHLSRTSARALPELQQVAFALASANVGDNPASACAAIDAAQKLSGRNFRSYFLPLSVFHPLDPEVRQIMPPVFNQLVYPTMHAGLESRIADLVAPASSANSPQSLSAFLDALLTLEDHILLYNRLASADKGGSAGLLELAGYLDPHTPAGRAADSSKLATALAWLDAKFVNRVLGGDLEGLDAIVRISSGPLLNGQPWIEPTTARLAGMIADPNLEGAHLIATLGVAASGIDQLSDSSLNTFQQPDKLNKLNATLDQLKAQSQSAASWFAAPGPATDIDKALQPIFSRPPLSNILLCDSTMLPKPCSNLQDLKLAIQIAAAARFDELRGSIKERQTAVTGPLLDTAGALQLSQPTASLQSALQGYLKLPFVAAIGCSPLRGVAANEELLWDNNRLQAAIQDKTAYDGYYAASLANAPVAIQDVFEDPALDRLRAGLIDALGSAQQFQLLPPVSAANAAALAAMAFDEARSLQAAQPLLNQVLDLLNELHFNAEYDTLERVTTGHALSILLNLDRNFEAMRLYQPPKGSFNPWTTGTLPSVTVYQLKTGADMNTYLTNEMQQVQKFSTAAGIAVAYLQQHMLGEAQPPAVAAKWQGIAADLQKYVASAPASGVGSLEQFLATGMNLTTPPDCQVPVSQVNSSRIYFVQVRDSLEQELMSRCHSLANQYAADTYTQLAAYFNSNLKGKFPFSAPLSAQDEANPDDVIGLFTLLDRDESPIRAGLKNASGLSDESKAAIKAFLSQLDDLRPLFTSLLSGQPGALPAFDIAPVFRVNRGHELNGKEIAAWRLTIGDSANRIAEWTLGPGDAAPRTSGTVSPAHWTYGDPISLTLRWAADTTSIPVSTPPAVVDAKARTAVFQFADPWSLLKMAIEMAPSANYFERHADPDPQTMLFCVNQSAAGIAAQDANPCENPQNPSAAQTADQPVKVFVRIRIFAPGKTEPLRIPAFPVVAPSAVLATGSASAKTYATTRRSGQ